MEKKQFQKALREIKPFVDTKSLIPSFDCVKVMGTGPSVYLEAMNSDGHVQCNVHAGGDDFVTSTMVPFARLQKLVNAWDQPYFSLGNDADGNLTLEGNETQASIEAQDLEFPTNEPSVRQKPIGYIDVMKDIAQMAPVANINNGNNRASQILSCVHLSYGQAEAADGHVLLKLETIKIGLDQNVLVPARWFPHLAKFGDSCQVSVSNNKRVTFNFPNATVTVRREDGTFPDTAKIIKGVYERGTFTVDSKHVRKTLKPLRAMLPDNEQPINIAVVEPDQLLLTVEGDRSTLSKTIPLQHQSGEITPFIIRWDILKKVTMATETLAVTCNTPTSAYGITDQDNNLTGAFMPINKKA